MPQTTIPLIGPFTARGWSKSVGASAKDQQFINVLYDVAVDSQSGKKVIYALKRPGYTLDNDIAVGASLMISDDDVYIDNTQLLATATNIYLNDTPNAVNIGTIGSSAGSGFTYLGYCGGIIGGKKVVAFNDSTGGGYYLYEDAYTTNFPTFTGNRTAGSPILTGIASTTGIYAGQAISGTGIPAGTRVLTVDSATQITMTANATSGAGTATVVTKEAIAKITSANFPDGACRNMQYLNGYFFALGASNKIYNSKINDPSTWAASHFIVADWSGAQATILLKIGNTILCATKYDLQYFRLQQNQTGSVLSRVTNLNKKGIILPSRPLAVIENIRYALAATGNETGSATGELAEKLIAMSETEVNPVSDDIWSEILSASGYSMSGAAVIGSKKLILIRSSTASPGTTLWHNPSDNTWGIIATANSIGGSQDNAFASGQGGGGETLMNVWSNGNVYTDAGADYTMTIQTEPYYLNNGEPFIIDRINLVADTESSGSATLTSTANDYSSFNTLGDFDMTAQQKSLQAGSYYDASCAFKLTHSANAAFRGQALVVTWRPLG